MFWIIAVIVLVIVALTLLVFRVEDFSDLDKEIYPVKEALPSPEHNQVLERIREMTRSGKGLHGKARIMALRGHMDSLCDDREFESEFRPSDNPNGEWVIAPNVDTRRRILYIHGGAWAAGSPRSHRGITDKLSHIANAAVFAVDYRLMPEHRFMEGVSDCRNAYTWLVDHGPNGPEEASFMLVAGDSAGGSHTLGLLAWLRESGLRQADGGIALSPSTDLTLTAPSNRNNIATDPMLGPMFGSLSKIPKPVIWWATLAMFRISPTSSIASPLRGDLTNLPPVLIQVSDSEMLLDNARRYAAKAKAAGSKVELHTWPGMVHVWQIFTPLLPEAEEAFADMAEFINNIEARKPKSEAAQT